MNKYDEDNSFADWAHVQNEFQTKEPEPENLLYAIYEQEFYEGNAEILWKEGDKYKYVNGSHCSCYGLEGQFDTETFSEEVLRGMIARIKENNEGRSYKSKVCGVQPEVLEKILNEQIPGG